MKPIRSYGVTCVSSLHTWNNNYWRDERYFWHFFNTESRSYDPSHVTSLLTNELTTMFWFFPWSEAAVSHRTPTRQSPNREAAAFTCLNREKWGLELTEEPSLKSLDNRRPQQHLLWHIGHVFLRADTIFRELGLTPPTSGWRQNKSLRVSSLVKSQHGWTRSRYSVFGAQWLFFITSN